MDYAPPHHLTSSNTVQVLNVQVTPKSPPDAERQGDTKSSGLNQVSLCLGGGESVVFLGNNGAGKTTMIRLLLNRLDTRYFETSGGVVVPRRELIGVVSTDDHISCIADQGHLTVADVVSRGLTLSPPEQRLPAVTRVATCLRLDSLLPLPFASLSQGQQKLSLVATALAEWKPLVIMDEVTQGLDVEACRLVFSMLRRYVEAKGSLIYVTHHKEEIQQLGNNTRVLHFENGHVSGD
eukprot:CAMPEP_0175998196 /NCGR_PEP_ID=MMETSP0108-20121206/56599_1 /TAXON_ID=195067 ORGANISM="Goniomonas pacifica, Strain CCMP1869" /NCGR_SAMPLE_ID=MMETSP0108 /ASSEMBLY_ACC=CAM_ASM_000204 /LENGTH=236 /DNA_ID=CAMNT_0017330495 /DNA_START=1 /DNA_END=711 /DNA_ORIENTATION=+